MSLVKTTENFFHFCRTGELDPSLNIVPEKIQIYHELVRNNIEEVLYRAFPLTFHLLTQKQWNEMLDLYLAKEDFTAHSVWRLPQALVRVAMEQKWAERWNIPYLLDLLHFEWIEIEIDMMPDLPRGDFKKEGRILDDLLVLNPESQIIVYSYPVYEKNVLPREMKEGIYPVLVLRHPDTGEVHFIALSRFFLHVYEMLTEHTGREALIQAAKTFQLNESKALSVGEKFLIDLMDQQAIYGWRA